MIIQNDPLIKLSISATTRAQRPQEVHGQHYFFTSKDEFLEMHRNSEFLESAEVFENHYGTPKKTVIDEMKKGNCVLFDIDWQGARQVKNEFDRSSVISIFILPPSLQELERRLHSRAQDSKEVVDARMKKAQAEISHYDEYDYILVNDDLNHTYQRIRAIIEAKRVERQDKKDLAKLIAQFS